MAEKEERISVIVYEKDPCKNCPGNPMTDCQVCEKDFRYDGGITITEAINRMAKAFFKSWYGEGFEQEHPDLKRRYRESAEAALNALLSSGE